MLSQVGYQGFGSFHSEDVEELITQASEEYKEPPLPVIADFASLDKLKGVEFGHPARDLFLIDFEQWSFVNHGQCLRTVPIV
jgi:hypothetical protein